MGDIEGLRCVRCERRYPLTDMYDGCPDCRPAAHVNLVPVYESEAVTRTLTKETLRQREATMWRYAELLAVDACDSVSLGEGMTPLVHCKRLGDQLDMTRLYVKDERCNPTGSFKDRFASAAISMARQHGVDTVICSSTGNQGLATAAYAAQAGLNCVVLTTTYSPPLMSSLMRAYGATVVATAKKQDRWTLMRACVEELDWFPVSNYSQPLVGSNFYGVDGYKTIGLEICEQLGWQPPDVIAVPSAYGEGLWGAWLGCVEAERCGFTRSLPRLVAGEVYGPLSHALENELPAVREVPSGETIAYSVGSGVATFQALHALRLSEGTARTTRDEKLLAMVKCLAKKEGLLAESSSALALVAIAELRAEGWIGRDDVVVAVLTSSGVKDPTVTASFDVGVPVVAPTLEALQAVL